MNLWNYNIATEFSFRYFIHTWNNLFKSLNALIGQKNAITFLFPPNDPYAEYK